MPPLWRRPWAIMIQDRPQSSAFREVTEWMMASGLNFRFRAKGRSMLPIIHEVEILYVQPISAEPIRVGDIVLFKKGAGFKAHRVIRKKNKVFITRGDAGIDAGDAVQGEKIVGKITSKECGETRQIIQLDGFASR